jgi:hypothetical protein
MRLAVIDAITTDVEDAEAAWEENTIVLRPTWPILDVGRDTNSPNLEASLGQRLPEMCRPHSRGINVVECHTETFISSTATGMFVSIVGFMWKRATHSLHARFNV